MSSSAGRDDSRGRWAHDELAAVTDLSTRLGIEGGSAEHNLGDVAFLDLFDLFAASHDRKQRHVVQSKVVVVAHKLGLPLPIRHLREECIGSQV